MTAAAISLPSGDDDGVDLELPEHALHRSLEEAAVSLLGDDVITFLGFEFVYNFCAPGSLHCVRTPYLELLVNFGCVAVICVDYGNTSSTGLMLSREHLCSDAFRKGRKEGIKVYEFLKEPIIHKFGKDFYCQLEEAARLLDKTSDNH